MTKSTNATAAQKRAFGFMQTRTTPKKTVWHPFGLGAENRRDPAALTFARLGLLATRW